MAKKRERKYAKYTEEFRRRAVGRMKESKNIRALARELGIDRRLLYEWRERAADLSDQRAPTNRKTRQLEQENRELKRLLGEKAKELDFFKGALQKLAARRRLSSANGETASTTKSGE